MNEHKQLTLFFNEEPPKGLHLCGVSGSLYNKIIAKLESDEIQDLSDSEIERILINTCLPTKLIRITKEFRDNGNLVFNAR